MALETQLTKAIKAFLKSAQLTRTGIAVPDETAQTRLLETITDLLSDAIHEGRRIGSGVDERGLISAVKNLAGRAVEIVGGIIEQLIEKAEELIDAIFGSDENIDPDEAMDEVEAELDEWIDDYADMVAETEISAAVEEAAIDEAVKRGATQIYWNAEPDACERCLANAEASPIPIGADFPSSDTVPPAHPRCRCSTTTD